MVWWWSEWSSKWSGPQSLLACPNPSGCSWSGAGVQNQPTGQLSPRCVEWHNAELLPCGVVEVAECFSTRILPSSSRLWFCLEAGGCMCACLPAVIIPLAMPGVCLQIVQCLELMLDSLGSDYEGSESSLGGDGDEDMTPAIASSSSAPAALSDQQQHQQQQEQQEQEQPYLAEHLQPMGRIPAPPAAPLPLAPAAVVAAMSGPAALPAARTPGIAGVLGLASPSTPTAALQPSKQYSRYDVLTPSGGALGQIEGGHVSQPHSSSSQHLRSSSSQHPHSNQLGPAAAAGSTVKLASVLDENVYLQDL